MSYDCANVESCRPRVHIVPGPAKRKKDEGQNQR